MKKTFTILIVLLIATGMIMPSNAYAKSEKYNSSKLPEVKGPKKNIAVMDFENKGGVGSQWNIGTGMAEMLTTALVESGRFIVVERQAIGDVLAEQDFGASGRTTEAGSAEIGKILNSQILIRGAVTEFSTSSSGADTGVSFMGVGLGLSSSTAHVAVNIRIYDVTTGEVLDSIRCEGKANAGGISASYTGAFSLSGGGFSKTPLGKATQKVIDKAVYQIAAKMENVPWEGKVVTIKGDTIYINAGENSNILPGSEFVVYNKGEELIDPGTGISLGSEDEKIGRIQITSVEENFSKAQMSLGSASKVKRGDIVAMD